MIFGGSPRLNPNAIVWGGVLGNFVSCNPQVHYHLHRSFPLDPNQCQVNSFHNLTYFCNTHINSKLSIMHTSS
jgi:hypothetical protein